MDIYNENMRMAAERAAQRKKEREDDIKAEKDHLNYVASTRMMTGTARPGIKDEFNGFDNQTIQGYNEDIKK